MIKKILLIPVIICIILFLLVAYYEGTKAYWDYRVREMCAIDGGVTVYEKVNISYELYNLMPKVAGFPVIPLKGYFGKDFPAFFIKNNVTIRKRGPKLIRFEKIVKKRVDGKTIGKIVSYARIGGDVPTGLSSVTTYSCPNSIQIYAAENKFFIIEDRKEK